MEQRKKPGVLAVSGVKNSGKTTFLTHLIPLLKERGIRTAVIKHDGHSFEPDVAGTDSYRLRQAGAEGTAVFCDSHYMLIRNQRASLEWLVDQFPDVDLILLEGCKDSPYRKIEVVRKAVSRECMCRADTLLAVATDAEELKSQAPRIGLEDYERAAELVLSFLDE